MTNINKDRVWIIPLIVVIIAAGIFLFREFNETDYQKSVRSFNTISAEQAIEKIHNGEKMFIYAGREICPSCTTLVPLLEEASDETGEKIYYIDMASESGELNSFKMEYKIEGIPAIVLANNGTAERIITPQSKEEVIEILTKNK